MTILKLRILHWEHKEYHPFCFGGQSLDLRDVLLFLWPEYRGLDQGTVIWVVLCLIDQQPILPFKLENRLVCVFKYP